MAFRIPFNQGFWGEYLDGQEANLPPLPAVEQITDRVLRILGDNEGSMQLQGTNTYIVGTGNERILIDTGEGKPLWIKRIIKTLESQNFAISQVLLTHWHGDHTGGVADCLKTFPSLVGQVYKNKPDAGQRPIKHGQIFTVPGATLRAVFTPGHAIDHMCFVLEEENALFTGDNVLGHGYSVVQDLGTYLTSLRTMEAAGCDAGYPAHGAKIQNLPAKMHDYINHKESRIQKVYSTLQRNTSSSQLGRSNKTDGLTMNEIVYSIYGDIPEELSEKALMPFLQQALVKLAEDRKIGFRLPRSQQSGEKRYFATRTLSSPLAV